MCLKHSAPLPRLKLKNGSAKLVRGLEQSVHPEIASPKEMRLPKKTSISESR
jgi:hypothetical protein